MVWGYGQVAHGPGGVRLDDSWSGVGSGGSWSGVKSLVV